jgi:N4-(beta-N-acetylglucosaminyl)-L-asparaginase
MSPKEACLDALKRVARNFDNDKSRLEQIDINFYALRKDGAYAAASLWNGRRGRNGETRQPQFSVNDGGESRHEPCVHLLER